MKQLEEQILQVHSNISTSKNLLQSEKKDLLIPKNELSQKLKSIGEENLKFQQLIVRRFLNSKFRNNHSSRINSIWMICYCKNF
jgi:hypothetical protein